MKKYVFKPYSKRFPELFLKEKERISPHLKNALAIEHVGSTAVPNLGGKGIIDIAIAVHKEDMDGASKELQSLGYEFRPSFSTPDRFYLIIYLPDAEEESRRYHIHLTFLESKEWKELIAFRDYLRDHPTVAEEYALLKQEAVQDASGEGAKYRKLKEPLFKKVLAHMKEERIHFKPVDKAHRALVHHWLVLPHASEWFYGQGLKNTFDHLDEFLKGSSHSQYWLAFDEDHPFAFFITSSVDKPKDPLTHFCIEKGEAITLDMLIGDVDYLGKGLSVMLIRKFIEAQFPGATEVLIDPEASNARAIHVYEKAGFKKIAEFIPTHSPNLHYMMRLSTQKPRESSS